VYFSKNLAKAHAAVAPADWDSAMPQTKRGRLSLKHEDAPGPGAGLDPSPEYSIFYRSVQSFFTQVARVQKKFSKKLH
jgi:hypothetical protein